jgi:hypothetical protein
MRIEIVDLKQKFLVSAMYARVPPDSFSLYHFFQLLTQDMFKESLFEKKLPRQILFFRTFAPKFERELQNSDEIHKADYFLEQLSPEDLKTKNHVELSSLFEQIRFKMLNKYEESVIDVKGDFRLEDFFKKKRLKVLLNFYDKNQQQIYAFFLILVFLSFSLFFLMRSLDEKSFFSWITSWWSFLTGNT